MKPVVDMIENSESLISLIERSRRGDERAFAKIVDSFKHMAYGYAYAIMGDFHWAEDVAQEAFVEAWLRLEALRAPEAFPAWFKKIVYKHCDRQKRKKAHVTIGMDAAASIPSREPDPVATLIRKDEKSRVLRAIGRLPMERRTVVTLFYISGYTYGDIAAFLNIPVGTVKSRLHASRESLREEMIKMVEDTIQSHKLPDDFTEKTIQRAIERAKALHKEHKFDEAEKILRGAIESAPDHPAVLKELNRNLMWGHVYQNGEWNSLSEIASQGRKIIDSGSDDEYVYHETAQTLLSEPRMPEAVTFIENSWIPRSGPNVEKLAMLAWAKSCVAEYDAALKAWQSVVDLTGNPEYSSDVYTHVPVGCGALVDSLTSAKCMDAAQKVARDGWELCKAKGDHTWLGIYNQAELDYRGIGHDILDRLKKLGDEDPANEARMLAVKAWVDDFETFMADWLDWLRSYADNDTIPGEKFVRNAIQNAFRPAKKHAEYHRWARETWQTIAEIGMQDLMGESSLWKWEQNNVWVHIESGEYDEAERIVRNAIHEEGYKWHSWALIHIAIHRGSPTPTDLRDEYLKHGIDGIDDYGMDGSYLAARVAAESGNREEALEWLEKAISYWRNPPLMHLNLWENDPVWGAMIDLPERKELFEVKRQSIGPIYGQLHYFPGW